MLPYSIPKAKLNGNKSRKQSVKSSQSKYEEMLQEIENFNEIDGYDDGSYGNGDFIDNEQEGSEDESVEEVNTIGPSSGSALRKLGNQSDESDSDLDENDTDYEKKSIHDKREVVIPTGMNSRVHFSESSKEKEIARSLEKEVSEELAGAMDSILSSVVNMNARKDNNNDNKVTKEKKKEKEKQKVETEGNLDDDRDKITKDEKDARVMERIEKFVKAKEAEAERKRALQLAEEEDDEFTQARVITKAYLEWLEEWKQLDLTRNGIDSSSDDESAIIKVRQFLQRKLPKESNIVECYVDREKGSLVKGSVYKLYHEATDTLLLVAKKITNKMTSYYAISQSEASFHKDSDFFVGKLRANIAGSHYNVFNHGKILDDLGQMMSDSARSNMASFSFSYDKMGPGSIFFIISKDPAGHKQQKKDDTLLIYTDQTKALSSMVAM